MLEMYIDNECEYFDYLEMYVDLDNIAIFGNRDYTDFVPEWFETAKAIMDCMDFADFAGEGLKEDFPELSREKRLAIVRYYDYFTGCRYRDDRDVLTAILNIIYMIINILSPAQSMDVYSVNGWKLSMKNQQVIPSVNYRICISDMWEKSTL